ncbi:MAG: AAA family ATPase [Patescibacteria group bacterium]
MPHLLKRLELNGFKSFAGKAVLEFPAGITAIVGPNGSGKSNIIDAIRWLLGEREAKNLRGGKGEDLIFAGTPKRARTGMAQASLHFENHNRFFPVDFEELTVMRQTNRDGNNQYYINKAEVRLKDLIDFFAQARLGSRGITVVTQGNSDMFIRATLKERREMIEEVLGLKEYQLKKAEAERRLKNSKINLDKVHALLEEILPHLRSLKRQTNRWEKRGDLETELRELENKFFGSQLGVLSKRLSEVEERASRHEAAFRELETVRERAEHELARLEGNAPKERAELGVLKKKTQELFGKRSELQKELGRLEAQVEIYTRKVVSSAHAVTHERLSAVVLEVKDVLSAALNESSENLRKAVEKVIKEIDGIMNDSRGDRKKEEGSAILDPKLSEQFAELKRTLLELESEIAILREREIALETNQEKFYALFKAALSDVQRAGSAIEEWNKKQQEFLLERERITMRRSELFRQIEQVGRSEKQFQGGQGEVEQHELSEIERRMFRLRGELAAIGEIDEAIMKEARETEERYTFLERESKDLVRAEEDLRKLITDLNEKIRNKFEEALHDINREFQKFFELMFGGGTAKLKLVSLRKKPAEISPDDIPDELVTQAPEEEEGENEEEGVEVHVSLPRKKISSLDALSGGERSLVGIAALFALISVSPPPFLVLDEIDAPLDDRNARRFADMLKEFSKHTQFIVVTHNRATMEAADVLYGVTLHEDGTSKVVSMKFKEAEAKVPVS